MIKAIIFDFYDVIHGDPYKAWLNSHGFKREGSFADASEKLDLGEIDVNEFLDLLSNLSGETPKDISDEFEAVSKVDQTVVKMIDELHTKYLTALLSNSPSDLLRLRLKDADLERRFDEIVISGEVGVAKPSKEIFEIVLERLKINQDEAIFVDDNEHHVDSATKMGIKSIQFVSTNKLKDDLAGLGI